MNYKVKKGCHKFWPEKGLGLLKFRKRPKYIVYEVYFPESAMYIHGDNDQFDWNKGGGFSFDPFTNHKNSFMWAWRFNPSTLEFEVTHYVHDGDKIYKGDDKFLSVSPGKKLLITIDVYENKYSYWFMSGNNLEVNIVEHNNRQRRCAREINPWFGGNKKAPSALSFWMKKSVK